MSKRRSTLKDDLASQMKAVMHYVDEPPDVGPDNLPSDEVPSTLVDDSPTLEMVDDGHSASGQPEKVVKADSAIPSDDNSKEQSAETKEISHEPDLQNETKVQVVESELPGERASDQPAEQSAEQSDELSGDHSNERPEYPPVDRATDPADNRTNGPPSDRMNNRDTGTPSDPMGHRSTEPPSYLSVGQPTGRPDDRADTPKWGERDILMEEIKNLCASKGQIAFAEYMTFHREVCAPQAQLARNIKLSLSGLKRAVKKFTAIGLINERDYIAAEGLRGKIYTWTGTINPTSRELPNDRPTGNPAYRTIERPSGPPSYRTAGLPNSPPKDRATERPGESPPPIEREEKSSILILEKDPELKYWVDQKVTARKVKEWASEFSLLTEEVFESLKHCRFELVDQGHEAKVQKRPVDWFYGRLKKKGYYDAPSEYVSFEEKKLLRMEKRAAKQKDIADRLRKAQADLMESSIEIKFQEVLEAGPGNEIYDRCFSELVAFTQKRLTEKPDDAISLSQLRKKYFELVEKGEINL